MQKDRQYLNRKIVKVFCERGRKRKKERKKKKERERDRDREKERDFFECIQMCGNVPQLQPRPSERSNIFPFN